MISGAGGTLELRRMRRAVRAALLLLLGVSSVAGADLTESTTSQHEIDLGREVARQVERTMPVSQDKLLQDRADRVGQALVAHLERRAYPYQFTVLAVADYNAFALPGGFVYLNEGLLAFTPDDDALAFVMAHELAHVSRRHWARRTEKMKGVTVIGVIASIAIGGYSDLAAAIAGGLVAMKYSRSDEYEADATAIEHMWQAGFDPAGAVTVMSKIEEIEKGKSVPRYLRDHPPARDRRNRLEAKLAELTSRTREPVSSSVAPIEGIADPSEVVGVLPEVELAPNPWFPLGVGNTWTYRVQQGSGVKSSYTMQIRGAIPTAGEAVYRGQIAFGETIAHCQFLSTSTAIWRRSLAAPDSPWQIECVFRMPADQTAAAEGWEYSCLGTEEVVAPCGTFADALKVRKHQQSPAITVDAWFVAGIGMVKRLNVEAGVTEILSAYKVEPVAVEPEVTEPEVAEPGVAQPGVAQPEAAEPEVAEPEVAEPEESEPAAVEPEESLYPWDEPPVTETP